MFRWDLDKTYLKTEFDTVSDLLRIARLTAEERENIPGSAALLRAIKASTPQPDAHGVYFISGSPNLIRAVIEKKFNLDGFTPDGFTLKPTLSDVFRGRFRAVRAQVGYKLAHLIEGRSHIPIGTPETLFGDDAENDAFIYSLYADIVEGKVDEDTVLEVLEAAGAYPDQIDDVRHSLGALVHEPAIDRIIIHLDQKTPIEAFAPFLPRVIPIRNHLQTAIILVLDGTLPAEVVRVVAQELLDRYGFSSERLIRVGRRILEERRVHAHALTAEQLAHELRAIDPSKPPPGAFDAGPTGGSVEATHEVLQGLAEVAENLPRVTTVELPAPPSARNYLELWDAEVARVEEHRRRRKKALESAAKAGSPAEPAANTEYARAVADIGDEEPAFAEPEPEHG